MKFSAITALAVFGSNLLYLIHLMRPPEPSEECQEEMFKVDRCMHEAAAADRAWRADLDSAEAKIMECVHSKIDADGVDPGLRKCQEKMRTFINNKSDRYLDVDLVLDLELEKIAEEVVDDV